MDCKPDDGDGDDEIEINTTFTKNPEQITEYFPRIIIVSAWKL